MDDRGFNTVQAGTLSTVEMMAVAGSALVAAHFMSRLCVVRVAIGGTLMACLAQLGSTLPNSFGWLAAARRSSITPSSTSRVGMCATGIKRSGCGLQKSKSQLL